MIILKIEYICYCKIVIPGFKGHQSYIMTNVLQIGNEA
jgi:hypothetical protein